MPARTNLLGYKANLDLCPNTQHIFCMNPFSSSTLAPNGLFVSNLISLKALNFCVESLG